MIQKLKAALSDERRDYVLYVIASLFIAIGIAINDTTFANRLNDDLHIGNLTRTILEFPRELPGFLVVFIVGALLIFGDIRAAMIANLLAALGMFAFGWINSPFYLVIFSIFLYSSGQHFFMPLANSIGMSFAKPGEDGRMLGHLSSISNAMVLVSAAILYLLYYFLKLPFVWTFTFGGISYLIAVAIISLMDNKRMKVSTKRFILDKKFSLFYQLSLLNGIRKQFLITFAPWVLITVFNCSVVFITALYFIICLLGVFLRPVAGRLIDSLGEQKVLMGEAFLLFVLCFGYIFADLANGKLFNIPIAALIFASSYIVDNAITFVGMARSTYVKKIATSPEEVSPTLAMGITMDHVVAMIMPMLGGLVWLKTGAHGYKYVFMMAAFVSVLNFLTSRRIKIKNTD